MLGSSLIDINPLFIYNGYMGRRKGYHHKKESIEKIRMSRIGSKNPMWKGGVIFDKFNGRIWIWCPDHPNSNHRGYVAKHRLEAEKKIGRYLRKDEIVHHKDGNKLNDDFNNIEVMTQAEHMSLHTRKYFGCKVDGCKRKHRSRGYCAYHYNKFLLEGRFNVL